MLCKLKNENKVQDTTTIEIQEKGNIIWNERKNTEYNIYASKWMLDKCLEYNDSSFEKQVNKIFYNGPKYGYCKIFLKWKESRYYECIIYNVPYKGEFKINHYDFDKLYLITPDSVYKLKPEPIKYKIDTISSKK